MPEQPKSFMEGFQQGLSNLVPLALKAQEIKREDAKAKLDFQMKNEKLQFEKIDFLNKLKEAEAKNVAKNMESLQKAGDIEGLQALIPRAQELGLMVPMSPQPNVPEGLAPPAQPWVQPSPEEELSRSLRKTGLEEAIKAKYKEPKEPKYSTTAEALLTKRYEEGEIDYPAYLKEYNKIKEMGRAPEKKTFDEQSYLEWVVKPENLGKSRMDYKVDVLKQGEQAKIELGKGAYSKQQQIDDARGFFALKMRSLVDPMGGGVMQGKELEYNKLMDDLAEDLIKINNGETPNYLSKPTKKNTYTREEAIALIKKKGKPVTEAGIKWVMEQEK